MSFGMIFSVFLIVVFIVVAFIAIKSFLDIQRTSDAGLFYREFQEAVDDSWAGQASEFKFKIDLPSKVEKLCFANLSAKITGSSNDYLQLRNYDVYEANVFLIPPGDFQGLEHKWINHLDIEKITLEKNPYCVDASGSLSIKKDFYDKLVYVH